MKTKHTPGPWTINGNVVGRRDGYDWRPVVKMMPESPTSGVHAFGFDAENDANAKLIAAAPELAAELRALVLFLRRYPDDSRLELMLATARAALVKGGAE